MSYFTSNETEREKFRKERLETFDKSLREAEDAFDEALKRGIRAFFIASFIGAAVGGVVGAGVVYLFLN